LVKVGDVVYVPEPCVVDRVDRDFVWCKSQTSGAEIILLKVMLKRSPRHAVQKSNLHSFHVLAV
jgi:hypothetical protein